MDNLIEKVKSGQYVEVKNPFFSVSVYNRYAAAAEAREVIVNGDTKLILVRNLIGRAPRLDHPNYTKPEWRSASLDGETIFFVSLPLDSFFLGGVDLSDDSLPADKSEYLWQIRRIVVDLRQQGIAEWETQNNLAFPLAFSPSEQSVYGLIGT